MPPLPITSLRLARSVSTEQGILARHRPVFSATMGAIWGIDSFDRWGVDLGKVLAVTLEKLKLQGASEPERMANRMAGERVTPAEHTS